MNLRTACLLVILTSIAIMASATGNPSASHDSPDDVVVTAPAPESGVKPSEPTATLFGRPTFASQSVVCGDSEAPVPPDAIGLLGCPIGPTCFSDAQCAFACPVGTGVCAPNFCCWCIVG